MLYQQLKTKVTELQNELQNAIEVLEAFRPVKKGSLLYVESCQIYTARDGVGTWQKSYKPSILLCKDWGCRDTGYAIYFNVVASEDPEPYNPPYELLYSGQRALIHLPNYHGTNSIKIITHKDLALYLHLPYKTQLFEKILKRKVPHK
jgi:hypothetical protein